MKKIVILGAGRSAYSLINYLIQHAEDHAWEVLVGDRDLGYLNSRFPDQARLTKFEFDVMDTTQVNQAVQQSDLVISMLPARFHPQVAAPCLEFGKHLVTASYVSPEMQAMHEEAQRKGLLFLNEIGLDPGIDHLSAKKVIDDLKNAGAELIGFESFTGGLVAPESDNNCWNYKFTWNPRNVVLAGQGTALFMQSGQYKFIPYHRLFSTTKEIQVSGYGLFEGYPNRDSLKYREIYGLETIPTMLRGTLRRPGFCKSWDHFIQLGLTDDSYTLENSERMTYREFINSFLPFNRTATVEQKVAKFIGEPLESKEMDKLRWLGFFSDEAIGLPKATPAQVLQHILEKKWSLDAGDKDMIVMQHLFHYVLNGKEQKLTSSLVIIGDDVHDTAMSKGVGLPLAMATKLILTGKIQLTGVKRPTEPTIYEPILKELAEMGICFEEKGELVAV
ncbi:MAG: saccharopine dehydrogenase family protein [Flammeovirgaceae bacterium]